MREFILISVLVTIVIVGSVFLYYVDSGVFTKAEDPEEVFTFEPMTEEEMDREMEEFCKELDRWSVVPDMMNYEYFNSVK